MINDSYLYFYHISYFRFVGIHNKGLACVNNTTGAHSKKKCNSKQM